MKLRIVIRTVALVCVVLLCIGLGVYSYLRLNSVEHRQDFNLYTLVPQDAFAVVETDRMASLVRDINALHCSRDNHFLYVSELFVYLKNYLHTLVDDTPHGLSQQMNQMLLSFHEPDTPMNQVLYCALGSGDHELVESFINKYCSGPFPVRIFDYEGEEIRIYPLANGEFLAAYVTSEFLAISFQKRLIERVIDARRQRTSLYDDETFRSMRGEKHAHVPLTAYVRMEDVDMGKPTDGIRSQSRLGNWAEFDMKFAEDFIYCSGVSHGTDSIYTFMHALRKQTPVEGFPGDELPASTFFYNNWSMTDSEAMLEFTVGQEYAKATYSDYIKQRDEELSAFLRRHGDGRVMSCLFHAKDTAAQNLPCAVMRIALADERMAERALRSLLQQMPAEADAPLPPALSPCYDEYPKARPFRQYLLPRNTLLTRLTGITESALHTYACVYRGSLLLAPDARSLSAYIDALERDLVAGHTPMHEQVTAGLSPSYSYLMLLDMEAMLHQPESYVRLIPKFFFRQSKFFRHFVFAFQFTCVDDVVYPNIVLLYKPQ